MHTSTHLKYMNLNLLALIYGLAIFQILAQILQPGDVLTVHGRLSRLWVESRGIVHFILLLIVSTTIFYSILPLSVLNCCLFPQKTCSISPLCSPPSHSYWNSISILNPCNTWLLFCWFPPPTSPTLSFQSIHKIVIFCCFPCKKNDKNFYCFFYFVHWLFLFLGRCSWRRNDTSRCCLSYPFPFLRL